MIDNPRALAATLAVTAMITTLGVGPTTARADLVPRTPDLSDIVKNEDWARVLGKALFWDPQAGSDGMACASCHFSGGADSRTKNQINPGFLSIPFDDTFGANVAMDPADLGRTNSGAVAGPNYEVVAEDFPFHQLADITDRNSDIVRTTNDVMSSSGAYDAPFERITRWGMEECGPASGDIFHANGLPARQVEPRNTPTTINAVFYDRNFWDGRANNIFNGKDVFGRRDIEHNPAARLIVGTGYSVHLESLEVPNASLASQAVGPPLSVLEMSCGGRTFADVGRKMLSRALRPLGEQRIHHGDSLLGASGPFGDLRHGSGAGLDEHHGYAKLVKKAFKKKYWGARGRYLLHPDGTLQSVNRGGYSQMEHNFSMFWGLAIMLYESTLISDQSKFDTVNDAIGGCMTAPPFPPTPCDPSTVGFTELEADGFTLFRGGFGPAPGGRCIACHGGPVLSAAASTAGQPPFAPVTRLPGPSGPPSLEDAGFFNIGTRPVTEDRGVGGTGQHGNPLSVARQYKTALVESTDGSPNPDYMVDAIDVDPCGFFLPFDPADCTVEPVNGAAAVEHLAIDGAFKSPSLRNVALTPPYFHYGGYASLTDVMEFYARGGSQRDLGPGGDNSGTGSFGDGNPDGSIPVPGPDFGRNTSGLIAPLNLALPGKTQAYGLEALVAFMKTMTDPRVQCDMAPFDHPSLMLFNGHYPFGGYGGKALDEAIELPAVGQDGYGGSNSDLCIPNAGNLFAPGMRSRVSPY